MNGKPVRRIPPPCSTVVAIPAIFFPRGRRNSSSPADLPILLSPPPLTSSGAVRSYLSVIAHQIESHLHEADTQKRGKPVHIPATYDAERRGKKDRFAGTFFLPHKRLTQDEFLILGKGKGERGGEEELGAVQKPEEWGVVGVKGGGNSF